MNASPYTRMVLGVLLASCSLSGCRHRKIDSINLNEQLLRAVEKEDVPEVQQLTRYGADLGAKDLNGDSALVIAARDGNHEIVSLLLGERVEVKDLNEALYWASVSEPYVQVVKFTAAPIYPAHKFEPFDERYTNTARLLLDKGAEVDARDAEGVTALMLAAAHGETGVVKLLLERGANIDGKDNQGSTALAAAACQCAAVDVPDSLDAIQLLLEKGANIETRDARGYTPLMNAAGGGRTEYVALLLQNHAKIEARDNDGNTALLISSRGSAYATADTTKYLLDHGSSLKARNKSGETALTLAASGNAFERAAIVGLLLSRGANPRDTDSHGNTALELATKKGNSDVVPSLKRALAATP